MTDWDFLVRVEPDDDEDATPWLRSELLDLDVDAVEPVTVSTAPDGAKGVASTLAVWAGKAGLTAVFGKLRDWAGRNNRTVEVTIDGDTIKLTGATTAQQEQLVNTWLAKHAAST